MFFIIQIGRLEITIRIIRTEPPTVNGHRSTQIGYGDGVARTIRRPELGRCSWANGIAHTVVIHQSKVNRSRNRRNGDIFNWVAIKIMQNFKAVQ